MITQFRNCFESLVKFVSNIITIQDNISTIQKFWYHAHNQMRRFGITIQEINKFPDWYRYKLDNQTIIDLGDSNNNEE